jgi:hypothetical protein
MEFKKFIVIPIFIAVLAASFIVVDQLLNSFMPIADKGGFGWVTFQAWAMYFLAGGTFKGGVRTFLGYVMGILAAITIIYLFGIFNNSTGFWALPLAVLIVVIPMCSVERAHSLLDFVPALFVSSAVFFAFGKMYPNATMTASTITILTYCAIGMIYGIVTVNLRVLYEKSISKKA